MIKEGNSQDFNSLIRAMRLTANHAHFLPLPTYEIRLPYCYRESPSHTTAIMLKYNVEWSDSISRLKSIFLVFYREKWGSGGFLARIGQTRRFFAQK